MPVGSLHSHPQQKQPLQAFKQVLKFNHSSINKYKVTIHASNQPTGRTKHWSGSAVQPCTTLRLNI